MLSRDLPSEFRPWPVIEVGGIAVTASTLADATRDMLDYCVGPNRRAKPLFITSVNGQVLSICARNAGTRDLFRQADIVHCDGQPLVLLSRLSGAVAFPERVATTDLYPAVAALAAKRGATFYLLGGSEEANKRAAENSIAASPGLNIVGRSHGYLSPEDEARVVADIAALKPDILWVGLGAPREQAFCLRHREALSGVGIVKTSGGLFDFLSGEKKRAPLAVQKAGFEWLFRLLLEPRRLSWRYFVTNPHAMLIMARDLVLARSSANPGSGRLNRASSDGLRS
jgi:N-acetylglucosaminyldiphosphoundecaprenol N-acetyl-beta-D-mannosaminyltransferase